MKIYHSIEEFEGVENAVVTTGTFDGVHVGHSKIIDRLKEIATSINGETVLLTFFPHPRMVLFSDNDLKLITTKNEKIKLLEAAGIDHLIIHPFSREFSRLSSVEFVRDVLVNKLGTSRLVIGYNHHFGRNREGSFEHLKEYGPMYGFQVEEIHAQDIDAISVSSTKIRKALESGDIRTAKDYLTHDFHLSGIVVKGNNLGHKLGFPTANLKVVDSHKLIPANGVYSVTVSVHQQVYKGMLNIGLRPTIDGEEKTIEVHILDFEANIYGEEITLTFENWIREEQKFESLEALKVQLELDKQFVLAN
ncbi:MAG: bifunctional riboflavin kinase/FAD synthetase [Flavobacteriales bacterium]